MTPRRALLRYTAGLAALLLGAELSALAFEPSLAAASDRVLFKLALFRAQHDAARVLLGSSRFNDGLAGRPLGAFNASVPSSSLALQAWQLDRLLERPGVKQVVLEVSPHLVDGWSPPPDVSEERLAVLRQRRGLALENLPRLFALPFAARSDGSEWFRDRWLVQLIAERRGLGEVRFDARPARVQPAALAADSDPVRAWAQMAERARRAGAAVTFVAPPVDDALREGQCGGAFAELLAQLARRAGAPVLDYSCLAPPADFFISRAHLGAKGRAWFTASLKAELDALQ